MWNGKLAGNMDISMYLESNLTHMQPFCKVHGWKFPCTLNETYALARYREIPMYLAKKHMARYMAISMFLETKHMACYMEISLYHANETYGKIHGHFHILPYVSLQATLPVVLRKSIMAEISLYQSILAAQRNMEISVDLRVKEHWGDLLSTYNSEVPF